MIVCVPRVARVVRTRVAVRRSGRGAGHVQIMFRCILSNVLAPYLIMLTDMCYEGTMFVARRLEVDPWGRPVSLFLLQHLRRTAVSQVVDRLDGGNRDQGKSGVASARWTMVSTSSGSMKP
jgi:hypothetical protein